MAETSTLLYTSTDHSAQFFSHVHHNQLSTLKNFFNDPSHTINVNYNTPDALGLTPLLESINLGYDSVSTWLIEYADADIDHPDKFGNTPLLWATYRRNDKMVMLLLDRGADPTIGNSQGITPILYVQSTIGNQKCGNILLHYSPIARENRDLYSRISFKEQILCTRKWKQAAGTRLDKLDDSKAIPFFQQAGIKDEEAVEVWQLVTGTEAECIDQDAFCVAMRCIALIQRNEPLDIGFVMDVRKKLVPEFPTETMEKISLFDRMLRSMFRH